MSSSAKPLFLSELLRLARLAPLALLALCSGPSGVSDAWARRHVSDGKKPPQEADDAGKLSAPAVPAAAGGKPSKGGAGPAQSAQPAAEAGQAAAAPQPAAAAPKELGPQVSGPGQEAARAHFERGVDLYTSGDFPNAWLEFNSAYQIVPLVDLLNNLARCEVRMGRLRDALDHFQRFISSRPNDPDGEYIRQEIARLEGELGRKDPIAAPAKEVTAPPPPRRYIPIYGILTGAATLAALIAGAATLGVVNSSYNDLQARCAPVCNVADVNVLERQAYAGYGLLGVGAAGALTTGIVLYFELRSHRETTLRPLAGLSLSSPALAAAGRF